MNKNFLRAALLVLAGSYVAIGLAACNTVAGAGTDVRDTGQSIHNSAERAKN